MMTDKVTQIRADEVRAPNRVIAGNSLILEKLARTLNTVVTEREKNLRAVNEARAVLREDPPPAFDHEAAGRAVAAARVADLMSGSSTVDAVSADCAKQLAAADAAIAKHESRLAGAQQQLEKATSFLQALTAQGVALDQALRKEIAVFADEKSVGLADELTQSVPRYFEDFITYRAATWLKGVQDFGDKGKQFYPADNEMDLMLAVPGHCLEKLPEGWRVSETPGVVVFKSYVVKQLVQKRAFEILEAVTAGIYPKVAADLPRQQDS